MIKGECILRDVATAASVSIMKVHVSIVKFIHVLYTIHGMAESASPSHLYLLSLLHFLLCFFLPKYKRGPRKVKQTKT